MKPSERIAQLCDEAGKEVAEQTKRTGGFDLTFEGILRPIARYLDEQAEIERRRRALQLAILFARSDHSYDHERAVFWLSKAGLDVPCPILRGLWTEDIFRAAEREGLL